MSQIKNFFLKTKISWIFGLFVILISVYFLFANKYMFIYNVGQSMSPSIVDKSLLVIEKKSSLGKGWEPDMYDVVVFKTEKEKLVKRVIGLSGDSIEIREGEIFLNKKSLVDSFHGKVLYYRVDENANILQTVYINNNKEIIPEGYVWVIGDNRENSWFGLIPVNQIIGLVVW